ncbi:MAG: HEAT repeat domain-containing protein [Candidatus Poribacteria bacterium]|nr:HEAT repeat domain-containing protein [Candidatus Poribacteria bacterium]MDE0506473.1 HEAT repeat domain-containing protein [Candidatus Poribacteria bacterium]
MLVKIQSLLLIVILICAVGCENRYHDEQFKIHVQQLDSDLENRWSTNGVVVISVEPNGPAARAQLEEGELISYVVGEYSLGSEGNYGRAAKKSMHEDNNLILRFTDGRIVRLAVRRSGDKPGLKVDGNVVNEVKGGSPAANANIQVGDSIDAVIDERKIRTIDDYKEAIEEFTKHGSKITFRTTELAGVRIAAVEALGELGDARAVDPLMDIVEQSGDLSLRKPAIRSLARLVDFSQSSTHSTERFNALREKIADGRVLALAQMYVKRAVEADQEIRRTCIGILGVLKPQSAIGVLTAVMEDSGEVPGIRFQAGLGLSQIGADAVDSLIAAFERGDANVKNIAASALGNIGGIRSRDVLIDALDSLEDLTIRLTIVDALAKIGDAPAIQALQNQKVRFQDESSLNTFLNEVLGQLEARSM